MKVYSVSQIVNHIRLCLEEKFPDVWIEGEISNFYRAGSGHYYFTLKDAATQIRAVMFRGANSGLKFHPENGLAVLAYGHVSLYESRGELQVIIEHLEPKGVGSLQLAFEQLKKKLEGEGLFDPSKKKSLPFLPRKIGIVTSPTGAVIRDMIHVLTRRFPNIQILLSPVAVQGEVAKDEIALAIDELNERDDIDLLIVGRGGGSMEDLWAFNEEVVARAIARSHIPVISAVGHETDFTIADFVADLRAPTPSAAAELAVPLKEDLLYTVSQYRHRMYQCLLKKVENAGLLLGRWEAYFRDPARRLTEHLLRVDHIRERLCSGMERYTERASDHMKGLLAHLVSLDPKAILKRGYAIATLQGEGKPLKDIKNIQAGDSIDVRLHAGTILAGVLRTR